jgi:uncharacterized protein YcgL (UPF0745 family)
VFFLSWFNGARRHEVQIFMRLLPSEASIVPPPLPLVHPFNNPNILMNLTIKNKRNVKVVNWQKVTEILNFLVFMWPPHFKLFPFKLCLAITNNGPLTPQKPLI